MPVDQHPKTNQKKERKEKMKKESSSMQTLTSIEQIITAYLKGMSIILVEDNDADMTAGDISVLTCVKSLCCYALEESKPIGSEESLTGDSSHVIR